MRRIIVLPLIVLLLSACSSVDCPLNNTVYCVYSLKGDVDMLGDTLTVSTPRVYGADTILIDRGDCIIIWIGNKTTSLEKKFGIVFARKYQNDENRNRHLPILQIKEGKKQKEVDACFE